MTHELDGLRAVVTGGASGIGAAVVRAMLDRGAVVTAVDLTSDGVPDGAHAEVADVRDDVAVRAAVAAAADRMGGIDVVVNNAGIGALGTIADNDDAEWLRVLDVNVVGIARVTRAALPHLRASDRAAVVNMASIASWTGLPARAVYSATKGAVQALTLAMAADHVGEGIRVNAVAPGTADTPWVGRLLDAAEDREAAAAALRARQPLGRLVTAEEVAHAIASLATPLAASTTGTVLRVDGGMTAMRL
jgi:2-keto-3-deoxy-L-fuconate dehydrogenase